MTDHIDTAIEVLNRVHAADPTVLPALIEYRIPCNDAVADDPTVQVSMYDGEELARVGLLGIINGLFGTRPNGSGFIAADYDDEDNLISFHRLWSYQGD